ncbi:hypothetical protein [Candidatus Amarobacter glycogenicus]|uniref:hypothetical protein n=1 Tax=Candidatus Amarobacter glycogenicus TaxID=3140699 RepID=UPI003135D15D|nr:hypothetical protein [Dehalococcoidia bacterium]
MISQLEVNNPGSGLWLFPVTNVFIVSVRVAGDRARCFPALCRVQPLGVAVSWREWSSGVIYGAIGATTVAGIINTLYLVLMAILLVSQLGNGDTETSRKDSRHYPRGWGCLLLDVSVLSVVAPPERGVLEGHAGRVLLLPKRRRRALFRLGRPRRLQA